MDNELKVLIDTFLEEHRESEGGWAKVEQSDIEKLENIIDRLIELKCDVDPDGDYPIEYVIVNRVTHNRLAYMPLPYAYKLTRDQILDATRVTQIAALNVSIAAEQLRETAGTTSYLAGLAAEKNKNG